MLSDAHKNFVIILSVMVSVICAEFRRKAPNGKCHYADSRGAWNQ
jgi:hypothetical protein